MSPPSDRRSRSRRQDLLDLGYPRQIVKVARTAALFEPLEDSPLNRRCVVGTAHVERLAFSAEGEAHRADSGVHIPEIFEIYNDMLMYGDEPRARMFYSWLDEKARADLCTECGECLAKCPQHIEIPDWLKKVHGALCQEAAA